MIPAHVLHRIAAFARTEAPYEVCGFLAGSGHVMQTIHPVPNIAKDPEREFVMEPQKQIDAMREIHDSGMELFGTYHSHPATPPIPSARDMQLALYPDLAHIIVSLAGNEPEFGVWRISTSGYKRLEVERSHPKRPRQMLPGPGEHLRGMQGLR